MTETVEDLLRAAYEQGAKLVDTDRLPQLPVVTQPRSDPRAGARRGRLIPSLAAGAVLAVTVTSFALAGSDGLPPSKRDGSGASLSLARPATPSRTTPSSVRRSASGIYPTPSSPHIGVSYPFQAYTHCGTFEIGQFDGRYWVPASPVPAVPRPRPNSRGEAADNGYTYGTIVVVNSTTLRFVVDDDTVMTAGVTVTFHPAGPSRPASGVCA